MGGKGPACGMLKGCCLYYTGEGCRKLIHKNKNDIELINKYAIKE